MLVNNIPELGFIFNLSVICIRWQTKFERQGGEVSAKSFM